MKGEAARAVHHLAAQFAASGVRVDGGAVVRGEGL